MQAFCQSQCYTKSMKLISNWPSLALEVRMVCMASFVWQTRTPTQILWEMRYPFYKSNTAWTDSNSLPPSTLITLSRDGRPPPQIVPTDTQKTFQIKQAVEGSGYTFTFSYDWVELVNIKKVFPVAPLQFENVSVYVSDSFTAAIPAVMEDLVIQTCKLLDILFFITIDTN